MEPFKAGQKGSSAMPHKRNPILAERIAGSARLLRGYAGTALEDQPLWHERDISHSSAERVILPDATILLDYMLVRMAGLVDGLVVRRSGCARTSSAARAARQQPRAGTPRRGGRDEPRGRLRHRSARRPPCRGRARPAAGAPRRRRRGRPRISLARLDACFDDTAVLRHVPAVIARLDSLEAQLDAAR
jgi:adenylosuccinate lyase